MKYMIIVFCMVHLTWATQVLRDMALKYGLKPVPKNLAVLKQELNEPLLTKEKIVLGKELFFDKALSLNEDFSCASCHSFKKGGSDQKPTAIGHKNQKNPFHLNTPTVLNTAYSTQLFWDGREQSLKEQAKGPLQANFEMAITPKLAVKRITQKTKYKKLFLDAFGTSQIDFELIVQAIAAYEKTLLTRGAFDDFLEGDLMALNEEQKEGLELFIRKSCVGCHTGVALGGQSLRKFPLVHHQIWNQNSIEEVKSVLKKYETFLNDEHRKQQFYRMKFNSNDSLSKYLTLRLGKKSLKSLQEGFFHGVNSNKRNEVMINQACNYCHDRKNNGVNQQRFSKTIFPFENVGGFVGNKTSKKFFRVPLLRNVVKTYPYFHNGGVQKLEDAIEIMIKHQHRTLVNKTEVKKIVAFLKSVDGELVEYQ